VRLPIVKQADDNARLGGNTAVSAVLLPQCGMLR